MIPQRILTLGGTGLGPLTPSWIVNCFKWELDDTQTGHYHLGVRSDTQTAIIRHIALGDASQTYWIQSGWQAACGAASLSLSLSATWFRASDIARTPPYLMALLPLGGLGPPKEAAQGP